jgi:hypothetical protein
MRIESWHSKEIFKAYEDKAMDNANDVMDGVVESSKQKCRVDFEHDPPIFRAGKFSSAHVEFTPKTGAGKGELVSFDTKSRWMGRYPGQLQNTIRRVNRDGTGSVRAYAGNFKVYYALMVEKTGYTDRGGKFHPPLHFLQAPFHAMKGSMVGKIAKG